MQVVRPAAAPARAPWVVAGVAVVAAAAGVTAWMITGRAPPPPLLAAATPPVVVLPAPAPVAVVPPPPAALPPEPIQVATEADIDGESPAVRTILRFALNPAIVVLDFPTLGEQGRMLNRVAAWAEKAGVPHDRLLNDTELADAITASGATPETYYYGHDYRGGDIRRFFELAERDGVALSGEERELRRLMLRAGAEAAGFGALITVVRASPEVRITPEARAVILHHELSHGEYFTSPAYAGYVQSFWQSMLTAKERASFQAYLASEGYDPALEDVIRNETQAYLMETASREFFDPDRLGIAAERLKQIRTEFLTGMPPGWLRDSTAALLPSLPLPSDPAAKPRRP